MKKYLVAGLLAAVFTVAGAGRALAWHSDSSCVDGKWVITNPAEPNDNSVAEVYFDNGKSTILVSGYIKAMQIIPAGGSIVAPDNATHALVIWPNTDEKDNEYRPKDCCPPATTTTTSTTTTSTTTSTTTTVPEVTTTTLPGTTTTAPVATDPTTTTTQPAATTTTYPPAVRGTTTTTVPPTTQPGPTTTHPPSLPVTGSSSGPLSLTALALLLGGGGLLGLRWWVPRRTQ